MSEERPKQYSVKRVTFNEYGQIVELEFFDNMPYTPEDVADFIVNFDKRLKPPRSTQPEADK